MLSEILNPIDPEKKEQNLQTFNNNRGRDIEEE